MTKSWVGLSVQAHVYPPKADISLRPEWRGENVIDSAIPFVPQVRSTYPAAPSQVLDLETVIHSYIHYVLQLNQGNKKKTARQLGISRSTLYRMLEAERVEQPFSF